MTEIAAKNRKKSRDLLHGVYNNLYGQDYQVFDADLRQEMLMAFFSPLAHPTGLSYIVNQPSHWFTHWEDAVSEVIVSEEIPEHFNMPAEDARRVKARVRKYYEPDEFQFVDDYEEAEDNNL